MSSSRLWSFLTLHNHKQLGQHVLVGMGAASFWRGAWYILDDHLFPNNKTHSAMASLALGTVGLAASQQLVERAEQLAVATRTTLATRGSANNSATGSSSTGPSSSTWYMRRRVFAVSASRMGALYTVAMSCVLVWRGTWVGWDVVYEYLHPHDNIKSTDAGHLTQSGIVSHVVAVGVLLTTGLFASVLAPPAATSILRDVAIRSGSTYVGPAQKLADRLFFSGTAKRAMSGAGKKK